MSTETPGAPRQKADWLTRLLLRAFPLSFRQEHGGDLLDLYSDHRRRAGMIGSFLHWPRSRVDIVTSGLALRLELRREARRARGIPSRGKESDPLRTREGLTASVEHLFSDLRYALRSLLRRPSLSLPAVLTLGLGIGFTTIMFSILHGVLYRGLPIPGEDRFYHLAETNPSAGIQQRGVSVHDYRDLREQVGSFEDLAASYIGTVTISGTELPERFEGAFITSSAFPALGVQPFLGRTFREGDDRVGAPLTVILGHQVWRDRYGSDLSVVGRVVRVNGEQATVIGVMPEGFRFPVFQEVWVPLRVDPLGMERGTGTRLDVYGRLREGVTEEQALAELAGIARRLEESYPESNDGVRVILRPYTRAYIDEDTAVVMYIGLFAVFLVLAVACMNVANLLLARTAIRMRELGIRAALGASRFRIIAHLLEEAGVLAVVGSLLGVAIATVGVAAFARAVVPSNPPYWFEFAVDGPILLFVLFITLLSALLSGVIPGLKATGPRVHEILKDDSRGSSPLRIGRLSRWLVMVEVAFSVAFLVSATLSAKAIVAMRTTDYGFPTEDVFTARVGLFLGDSQERDDPETRRRFFQDLLAALSGIPGTSHASLTSTLPGAFSGMASLEVEGSTYGTRRDYPRAAQAVITPEFFETFEVDLVSGRAFSASDDTDALPVAIVNQSFVDRHLGGEEALGRRIRWSVSDSEQSWLTIIGVAPDLHMEGIGSRYGQPQGVYLPLAQSDVRFMSVAVRSVGDPLAITAAVRREVSALHADTPIYFVQRLDEMIADQLWFITSFGGLFAVFGVAALFMAAVGLYGVMASSVGQRAREVGIRMALGAKAGGVRWLIVRQGILRVLLGLLVGLPLGGLLSDGMGMEDGFIQPWDLSVFLMISLVFLLTGVTAGFLPARQASRVPPMDALRDA